MAGAAAPAFRFAGGGAEINAEDAAGVDVEQIGLGIKAGRHPIGGAVRTGLDERAVGAGIGFGLGERASLRVNSRGPGLIDEGSGGQILGIGSNPQTIKYVSARLRAKVSAF